MDKRKQKGQGLVEFALILPILLLVVIGTIEFARIFLIYVNVSNAAREGARYGMVNPTDYIGINQRVADSVVLSIPSNLSVLIRYDTGPGGTEYTDPNNVAVGHRVIVEVQYQVDALTPIFAPFVPADFKVDVRNSRTIQSLKLVYTTPSPAPGMTTTPSTSTATPSTPASTATSTPGGAPTNTPGGPTNTPTNTPPPTSTPTPRPLIPIIITKPLWADTNVVRGTGEPNQVITLRIVQTGYQISGVIDASGNFMFTVWPLLVGGHTVIVQGYGSQDLAIVQVRTPTPTPTIPPTDPYIRITTPATACTNEQFATITVIGGNWSSSAKNMYLYWDGDLNNAVCVATLSGGNFTCTFDAFVTVGDHTITGIARKSNGSAVGSPATVPFKRPCSGTPTPSPTPAVLSDLRITGIRLQNLPPLGTYENLRVTVSVQNTGTVDVASLFWVDLYADATGVLTNQASIDYVAVNAIAAGSTVSFTMYVPGGFKTVGTHTLQAMVDTWNQVRETNEANNISALLPVTVTVNNPAPTPTPTPAGTTPPPGTIQGVTYLNGPPQSNVSVYVYAADGRLVGSGRSDANGNYTITNIPAGTYTVVGELRLANILYRGQVAPVNVGAGQTTTGVNIDLVAVP
ncbi:MAG TPA: TadE/TadG family type IV pilus assembly protein [Anaerolineae bacterium]|nr:TadE/TadG family type IV pilus assembly protein [Anaerolineae bacterium]HQI85907.1 TadE/TadG family type IV pilus assembly protein [Anaerolineae bacterium]